jgi:hypothetical protein
MLEGPKFRPRLAMRTWRFNREQQSASTESARAGGQVV